MATWKERASEIKSFLEQGKSYAEIAKIYGANKKTTRNRIAEMRAEGWLDNPPVVETKPASEMPTNAHESVELLKDGTYASEKPLWMTLENVTDPAYLLRAHGFNPDQWTLITARNNRWNAYSVADGIMVLYASKITVKPRIQSWTYDDLIEAIQTHVEPVYVDSDDTHISDSRLLEIPVYDAHFGVSTYDDYKQTQTKIYRLIQSRYWQETFFIVGQDLLHNDNFRGQTSNGTQIETVDIPKAWRDAVMFYEVLITAALRQSKRVFIMYAKANHDESISWGFVQYLKARFPQAEFDDAVQERKAHCFGNVFIGVTHGDKARKQLHNIFPVEFPTEWSQAKTRELHCGHLHVEDAKDVFGMMVRTLATRNKTDQWHRDNGFVGAHKRFQVFEYSTDELEAIHYV